MGWLNGRVNALTQDQMQEFFAQQREHSRRFVAILFLATSLLFLISGAGDLLLQNSHAWDMVPRRIGLSLVIAAAGLAIRRSWCGEGTSAGLAVLGVSLINFGLLFNTQPQPGHMSLVQVVVMLLAMMALPLAVRLREAFWMMAALVLPLLGFLAWRHEPPPVWGAALAVIALGVLTGLFMRRQRLEIALELFELRRQLEMRADLDMLTGLFNREGWFRSARQVFTLTRDTRKPMSLAYLDLDHFKRINDDFGHAAGDATLAAVADAMRRHSRRQDIMGRLGGEEFVLLMPGVKEQAAVQLIQDLCQAVRAVHAPRQITFSAGVCQVRITETLEAAMRRADHALLQAKREGRDRILRAR